MQHQLTKSIMFFQVLLYSCFRRLTSELVETLLLLSTGHLFGLYNPNQVADALSIPKAKLYLKLSKMSLEKQQGASACLGVKIVSYLLLQHVCCSVRLTFHQTQLTLSGQRQMRSTLNEHFHEQIPNKR